MHAYDIHFEKTHKKLLKYAHFILRKNNISKYMYIYIHCRSEKHNIFKKLNIYLVKIIKYLN